MSIRSAAFRPLYAAKRLIILTARDDYGYDEGGLLAAMNLLEAGLRMPLAYIGLTKSYSVAIEYDEFADERLSTSIATAEVAVDRLVDRLLPVRQSGRYAGGMGTHR